jgi:prepilin-type N-terminal cleavage/methylation domain-containing protein
MRNRHRRGGFTLVELLVVIGIIALLIGILIPVVSNVRKSAYIANTKNLLQKISAACTSYQLVFHSAPGVLPNKAYDYSSGDQTPGYYFQDPAYATFTQTEDLVCALSGGLTKDLRDAASKLDYKSDYLGQGPTSFNPLNPSKSQAFIAADPVDLSPRDQPLSDPANGLNQTFVKDTKVSEFMDKFPDPRPVIYLRANPGAVNGSASTAPQIISPTYNASYHYNYRALMPYVNPADTGEVLNQPPTVPNAPQADATVKYFTSEQSNATAKYAGTYILISAGPDRKFGTADDIISGGGGGQ